MEIVEAKGKNVKAFDEKPQLLPGLDFYMQAYMELLPDRQIGMAAGMIPWYNIKQYACHHGVDCPNEFDRFLRYIRTLESTHRQFEDSKDGK